jgi:hypothetical protein
MSAHPPRPLRINTAQWLQQLNVRDHAERGSRGPNLTLFERGRIIQAHEDRTLESIADLSERAPSTISRTIHDG